MKIMLLGFSLVATSFLASPRLAAQTRDLRFAPTRAIPVRFDGVDVPSSAHPDHEAIITVGGTFHSSCDRSIRPRVDRLDRHTHVIRADAMVLVDFACSYYERDYVEEISLGQLDVGVHQVIFEGEDGSPTARSFIVSR